MFDTENDFSLENNSSELNDTISSGISSSESQPYLNLDYTNSKDRQSLVSEFESEQIAEIEVALASQGDSSFLSDINSFGGDFSITDDSLDDAQEITLGESSTTYSDWVGESDSDDYYRFSLDRSSELDLSLTGLSDDADVQLLDASGNQLIASTNYSSNDETINVQLLGGVYYINVYADYSWHNTDYDLAVSATPVNEPGNTISDAKTITLGESATTHSDWVGATDNNDYYRFNLAESSNFDLSLTGLSDDADVQLLDSSGNELLASTNYGSNSESINAQLTAGTYYLNVYPDFSWHNTDYDLTVSARVVDDPGNSLDDAKEITVGEDSTTYHDWVGASDSDDYYRFSLTDSKNFNLSLTGLSEDADVQLLDSSGTLIAESYNYGSDSETIEEQLVAGTYYIGVYSDFSWNNTEYSLTVSAETIPVVPGYSNIDGFGLVDASSAVAQAIGQNSFADIPDLGGNDWGADLVQAPEVWSEGYTGEGVVVAVLDTGVDYNHSDLSANIFTNNGEIEGDGIDNDGNGYIDDFYGWNFDGNNNDTLDRQSHGTHVAGTIAGVNNDFGVTGIAYDAQIMPVKVLGDDGSGSFESVANGIRYAADNGAQVINMSLGGDTGSEELRSAVEYAASKGSVVVMASGNDGESTTMGNFPAAYATNWGIAVGAVDSNREMAYFSNRSGINPLTYVTAPGVSVYSTVPDDGYDSYSGTSMATPHVAGVVALMLDANPNLTESELSDILTATAESNHNSVDSNSVNPQSLVSLDADSLTLGGDFVLERQFSDRINSDFTTTNFATQDNSPELADGESETQELLASNSPQTSEIEEQAYNDDLYDEHTGLMSMEQITTFVTTETLASILAS